MSVDFHSPKDEVQGLVGEAREYLELMHRLAVSEAKRDGISIPQDASFDARIPVADFWLHPKRYSVHFFGESRTTVRYVFKQATPSRITYSRRLSPTIRSSFLRPDGKPPLVFYYDRRRKSLFFDSELGRTKARHFLRLFEAERHFVRNMHRIRSLRKAREIAKRKRFRPDAAKIRSQDLLETINIMAAGALESSLRDILVAQEDVWLVHVRPTERERSAAEIIDRLGLGADFVKAVNLGEASFGKPLSWLALRLGESTRRGINFQDLGNRDGVKWAYRALLGIDLPTLPVPIPSFWEKLRTMMTRRHRLIHTGRVPTARAGEIETELDAVRHLQNELMHLLLRRVTLNRRLPI